MQSLFQGGGGCGTREQPSNKEQCSKMIEDLTNYIDKSNYECKNGHVDYPVENVLFDKNEKTYVQSDCDPQLIISLNFIQPVKIHHLVLKAPIKQKRPKTLKLYANKVNMDFDQCEKEEPTQTLVLKDDNFKAETELKFVKFQNVKSITVFIEDNEGDEDQTILSVLQFNGYSKLETDMKNLKKTG